MSTSVLPQIDYRDIEALEKCVGIGWGHPSPLRQITDEEITTFAAVTNNLQWIHTDDERCAKESPYGRKIAHGLYLLSLIPGLNPTNGCTVVGHRVRIIRRIEHVRFPTPAFAGDHVCARSQLVAVERPASGKGVILTSEVQIWRWHVTQDLNDAAEWAQKEITERPVVSCNISFQFY